MVNRSRIKLQAGNIGDSVALPVPMLDRCRGTLAAFIGKNENELYTIPTKHDILSDIYTHTHELTSLFALNSC